MQWVINIVVDELIKKNNALEAMVSVLKEQIQELNIYKATLGNVVLAATPKPKFYPKYVEDEARAKLHWLTQQRIVREYVKEFSELMLQIFYLGEEAFFTYMNMLKSWAKQEFQCQEVKELSKVLTIVESLIELVSRKDKFESSKPKMNGNGGEDKER
ncbi:hypothetical protein J1N35_043711 [Gossypium stocksii]|uniref:Retrotransposon gag domain-containing protein n=1 Tax=Gossypium stocksii TaxID=47602 RepID=A0A9D3ZF77_9ROSI|nr:hypothetical protein J1N35_043711 [Gossypium stocksii]